MVLKTPKWRIEVKTIAKFLVEAGIIDCDPIGQRPDLESLKKKQGIIKSILTGNDICEIALRHMDRTQNDVTYEFRSVDGGHRKRSIIEFANNKFKTGDDVIVWVDDNPVDVSDKFFNQLPEEVQKMFHDYQLRFVIYDKAMTDAQAGEVFRLRNESTQVNHQEMLNSYEDNLVAKLVRETARSIRLLNTMPHQLFTLQTNSKNEIRAIYSQVKPSRLVFDEFVARFLCAILKSEGVTSAGDQELEDMYVRLGDPVNGEWVKNPSKQIAAEKELKKGLDFILQCAEARKSLFGGAGLTHREAVMLTRLYVYFNEQYGSTWVIKDCKTFFGHFKTTLDTFIGANPTQTDLVYNGTKIKAEAMKKDLGHHENIVRVKNSVTWFLDALNVPFEMIGLVVKDKTRGISRAERETLWLKQDKKCYIKGEPLDFEDSVGAHIIPHELGGKTDITNIVIIDKKLNAMMGSQNLEVFKKAWLASQKQAA